MTVDEEIFVSAVNSAPKPTKYGQLFSMYAKRFTTFHPEKKTSIK